MYPQPPYFYRGVEDVFVRFTAGAGGADALLPPGVKAADDPPICFAWARWVPFSSFGPYHEAYAMIRATFEDQIYLYQPFIFTDNEIPLGAGREIWGYAKKLAAMERSWTIGAGTLGEQMLFTVDRPRGNRIMAITMACDRLADLSGLEDLPVLSTKLIPSAEKGAPPAVAQLVRLDVTAHVHRSADGSAKLWEGRAGIAMDSRSDVDPWYLLAPQRIEGAWYGIFDFDLHHGRIVHDYLLDRELWSVKPAEALTSGR
jgi:acetoacetate decarboxylase